MTNGRRRSRTTERRMRAVRLFFKKHKVTECGRVYIPLTTCVSSLYLPKKLFSQHMEKRECE